MTITRQYISAVSDKEQNKMNMQALDETGFWGKAGAGVLPFAINTKRFLFPLRSPFVEEPNTWGIWGGAIDEKENFKRAALREFAEESGYIGKVLKLVLLSEYRHSSGFHYFSYLLTIPTEFRPRLDWETKSFTWVDYGKWPKPLHPKVKMLLDNFKVDSIIQEYVKG